MKNILIAMDFSFQSVQALEHGIGLSNHIGADLHLVHVIKNQLHYHPIFKYQAAAPDVESLNKKFHLLVEKYSQLTDRKIQYTIREGQVYSEICDQASKDNSSLVLMGTHGISGPDERWAGSNTLRVVSISPCPVLTIRKDCSPTKYRKILMPIDTSGESIQKVPYVAEIALSLGAEINLLLVVDKQDSQTIKNIEETTDKVYSFLNNKNIKVSRELKAGMNVANNTLEYARKIKADLITIMTERNENQLNSWIGPYASHIINHSPIPVLNFNPL